jgi:hypothetical protein
VRGYENNNASICLGNTQERNNQYNEVNYFSQGSVQKTFKESNRNW